MTNYSFAIWIVFSVGLLLLFVYAALVNLRRRHLPEVGIEEMIPALMPVNLQVLSSIASSTEKSSSAQRLEIIQRRQMRLATQYLRRMNHNAAVLQRIGYGQLNSPNEMVASQAQELIEAGVHVRLYSFVGTVVLMSWRLFGVRPLPFRVARMKALLSSTMLPAYGLLKSKAENLTLIRNTHCHDALVRSL